MMFVSPERGAHGRPALASPPRSPASPSSATSCPDISLHARSDSSGLVEAAPAGRSQSVGDRRLAAVILGNDVVLAARPNTPAQLARACVAAGFDIVVPPSWGDEL